MRASLFWMISAVGIFGIRPSDACPYCDSEVGREVSAGIFNGDFWTNTVLTLLPIPVMLLIVGLIHFGLLWPTRRESPPQSPR